MAAQTLHPQAVWDELGINWDLQQKLLTKVVEIPFADHEQFLTAFTAEGKPLGGLLPSQFKTMFEPTYLASLGTNAEAQQTLQQMGEAKSQCDIDSLLVKEVR
jgi:hypothetical protein